VTVWRLLLSNPKGAGFCAFELTLPTSTSLNVHSQSVMGQLTASGVVEASRKVKIVLEPLPVVVHVKLAVGAVHGAMVGVGAGPPVGVAVGPAVPVGVGVGPGSGTVTGRDVVAVSAWLVTSRMTV
jgi:hypothetical protein